MAADTQTHHVLPNVVYIQFAADIALSDGTLITVDNQFSHNNIEQIEFADGTLLDLAGIISKEGDDSLLV